MSRSSSAVNLRDRYRALVEFSNATAREQNLQTVLDKAFGLLSPIVPFGSIALLLDEKRGTAAMIKILKKAESGRAPDSGGL